MNKETEEYENDVDIVNAILKTLYSGPREKLAEKLLKRFGSFHGIFRASQEELIKVEGMTETSAAFFSAAVAEFRQALKRAAKEIRPTSEYDLIYLAIAMDNESTEKYKVYIYTDSDDKIIKCEKTTTNNIKKTVGTACGINAAKVAIIDYGRRTRKSIGLAEIKFLSDLVKPLNAVGIEFIDYIDYIGHKYGSVRRILDGESEYREFSAASKDKYEKRASICEEIEKYSKQLESNMRYIPPIKKKE